MPLARDGACCHAPVRLRTAPELRKNIESGVSPAGPPKFAGWQAERPCPTCGRLRQSPAPPWAWSYYGAFRIARGLAWPVRASATEPERWSVAMKPGAEFRETLRAAAFR